MSAGTVQVVGVTGEPAEPRPLHLGDSLVFGRGTDVDLRLGGDIWLSRRMGEIRVLEDGVRVTNLSRKHALHVETGEDAIKLPVTMAVEDAGAYLLPAGLSLIGTAAMLTDGRAVRIVVSDGWGPASSPLPVAATHTRQLSTQPRLKLDPMTKEFMVALLLCRPWLSDAARLAPLPTAPQIAKEALRVTAAHGELKRFNADAKARELITEQVHRPLRELRNKLRAQGLVNSSIGLGLENVAAALLYYDIITKDHLALLEDPEWLTAQEDKWWGSI
jgi:hypothetical protein